MKKKFELEKNLWNNISTLFLRILDILRNKKSSVLKKNLSIYGGFQSKILVGTRLPWRKSKEKILPCLKSPGKRNYKRERKRHRRPVYRCRARERNEINSWKAENKVSSSSVWPPSFALSANRKEGRREGRQGITRPIEGKYFITLHILQQRFKIAGYEKVLRVTLEKWVAQWRPLNFNS